MKIDYDTQELPHQEVTASNRWVRTQQVRLLYANTTVSLAATMVCAVTTALLLLPVANTDRLLAWVSAFAILTLLRLGLAQQFAKAGPEAQELPFWRDAFMTGVLLSGILWGALSVFLFPSESLTHQMFIAIILSGLCAGAVSSYSPWPMSFVIFAGPALAPFAVRIWFTGSPEHQYLTPIVILFLMILTRATMSAGKVLRNLLELQVKNAELTRALHYQATHDSLSGLVNHGEFQKRLERIASDETQPSQDYALIFVDLDLFKQVNDTGGHGAGDALLKDIAALLRSRSRSSDTVARVGGDEFAILLAGCPKPRAIEIGEQLREDIAGHLFNFEGRDYRVAASIGVAYGETGLHKPSGMLKAADAACYEAKESGRNRVHALPASDTFNCTGRFEITQLTATFSSS